LIGSEKQVFSKQISLQAKYGCHFFWQKTPHLFGLSKSLNIFTILGNLWGTGFDQLRKPVLTDNYGSDHLVLVNYFLPIGSI
jgi:hypothetical protein